MYLTKVTWKVDGKLVKSYINDDILDEQPLDDTYDVVSIKGKELDTLRSDKSLVLYDLSTRHTDMIIPHTDNVNLDNYKNRNDKLFDTYEDMLDWIEEQRDYYESSMYQYFQVIGYNYYNEHYIQLYYQVVSSNA